MPGDAQDSVELPDRPRARDSAWQEEDLEELDVDDEKPPGPAAGPTATGAPDEDESDDDEDEDEDEDGEDDDIDGEDEVDFAVVAYRDGGRWQVDPLPADAVGTWDGFRTTVAGRSGETGVIGIASLDDSALVVLRLTGAGEQILLSDLETADYLVFADDLVEYLRRTDPAVDELVETTDFGEAEDPVPVGELGLLGDLGVAGDDMRELCEDLGGEPEDLLEEIGEALGLGRALGDAVDAAVAAAR